MPIELKAVDRISSDRAVAALLESEGYGYTVDMQSARGPVSPVDHS